MRRLLSTLALVAVVPSAFAGSMLLATANPLQNPNGDVTGPRIGRVDGFCLDPTTGAFVSGVPRVQLELAQPYPRQLVFVPEARDPAHFAGVLFVSEDQRVEALRIDATGKLARRTRTEVRSSMSPGRPVVVHPTAGENRGTMYLLQRGFERMVAYPLDDDGLLPDEPPDDVARDPTTGRETETFTSCVQGSVGLAYADLVVQDERAYVSAQSGRIEVFGVLPEGPFCKLKCTADLTKEPPCADGSGTTCVATTPTECMRSDAGALTPTTPLLERRRLSVPTTLLVANGLVYYAERGAMRLAALPITGLLPPPAEGEKAPRLPKPVTHTGEVKNYRAMEMVESTILGTVFGKGRIDAFALRAQADSHGCKPDACASGARCCLPMQPRSSESDLRMSPTGLTAARVGSRLVLYVAGGDLDRVRAYRLNDDGSFKDATHFSETVKQSDTFPSAVQVAVLSGVCP